MKRHYSKAEIENKVFKRTEPTFKTWKSPVNMQIFRLVCKTGKQAMLILHSGVLSTRPKLSRLAL